MAHASAAEIRQYALAHGMMTLRQSGYSRVIDGTTSLEEVIKTTRQDAS